MKIKLVLVCFLLFGLLFSIIPDTQALITSGDNPTEEEGPKYVTGHLIVKFKEGKTPDDLKELNVKYQVSSSEKVFRETPDPKDTLAKLKEKSAKLGTGHESWYWQTDKGSREYKDYIAKIEKEKEALQKQILAQEELVTHLEQRDMRAQEGQAPPNLENTYLLKTNPEIDMPQMAAEYQSDPGVEYAEPDYIIKEQVVINDPFYNSSGSWEQPYDDLWGLKKIQVEGAWNITQGEGVIVGVVDSGIDYNHPDIKDNIWINKGEIPDNNIDDDNNGCVDDVRGFDFVYNDPDPMDDYGHGTHVAGTICATGNNDIGIIGIAPQARVMAVRAQDEYGTGTNSSSVGALKYAVDNGADVINCSWGSSLFSMLTQDAVNYAYSKGCVVIAAAGNSNTDISYAYPANLPYVISVSAIDQNDKKCYFSNFGPRIDVTAPGGSDTKEYRQNILSLLGANCLFRNIYSNLIVGSDYIRLSGTSMAAPHVSGVAALLLSQDPGLSPEQIRYILRNSSDDIESWGWDIYSGYGRLNAQKAVSFTIVPPKLYADISSPSVRFPEAENTYNKGRITIKGSAGGSDFSSYKLEYAKYTAIDKPVFKIISSNKTQVSDGILGEFDSSPIEDGRYFIRLTVYASSGLYTESTSLLYIDSTLKSGWPKLLSSWQSMPTVFRGRPSTKSLTFADLDNDGYKEVITLAGRSIYVLKYDGSMFDPNFPLFVSEPKQLYSAPTIADLDNDGKMEIILTTIIGPNAPGPVYAFHKDATAVAGFPAGKLEDNIPGSVQDIVSKYPAVVEDLDGDGQKEVVFICATYDKDYPRAYLSVLDNKGATKQGWPIVFEYKFYDVFSEPFTPVSVADLDKDGKKEIILGIEEDDKAYLRVYSYDGKIKNNISFAKERIHSRTPVLIVDVDNDANLELFTSVTDTLATGGISYDHEIYLLDNKGKVMPGWPQSILRHPGGSPYIFADLDADSDLEIICFGGPEYKTLYAFHHNGLPVLGFPVDLDREFWVSPAVIGHLKKSPQAAVFLSADMGNIYGFDNKGGVLENWPKFIPPTDGAAAVDDLDKDGVLEIGAHSLDGMIYIWQEEPPKDKAPSPWPTLYGNNQRTSLYSYSLPKLPPAPIVIDEGQYTNKVNQLTASWLSADGSGISEYQYSIGTSAGKTDILDWTSSGSNKSVTRTGLSLKDGQTYYFNVKAKSLAGLWSGTGYSDGISIDKTPPVTTDSGVDAEWHTDSVTVTLTAADTASGVDKIYYSLDGKLPTKIYTEPLVIKNSGKFTLRYCARDKAGNKEKVKRAKNQIKIDKTGPSKPSINTVIICSDGFIVYWLAEDKESGIYDYAFRITEGSSSGKVIMDWESIGGNFNAKKVAIKDLTKTYYVAVKAKNAAGLWSEVGYSEGIAPIPSGPKFSNLQLVRYYYAKYFQCNFKLNMKAKVTGQIWSGDSKKLIQEFATNIQAYPGWNALAWYGVDSNWKQVKTGKYILKLFAVDSQGRTASSSLAFFLSYNFFTKKYYVSIYRSI